MLYMPYIYAVYIYIYAIYAIYICYIYIAHIYIYMGYYSAIRKNEIVPFSAIWMDLEIIILSEV